MKKSVKKSTQLKNLPPKIKIDESKFYKILLEARVALAELKGHSFSMPNPLILLSPAILRESLSSSEIENIHTTMLKVLQNQLLPEAEQRTADKEVLRYQEAILWGFESMEKYSLSTRSILGIHKELIEKNGGKFRSQQNAIYNPSTKKIIYIPPAAAQIDGLIGNWENFVNKNKKLDPLVRTAIAHYQFEAVHPFSDGNGRAGRILMVLQLIQDDILKWPILYISGYINQNRAEYYRLLKNVTDNDDWISLIIFMLKGFKIKATETKDALFEIMGLFENLKKHLKEKHRKIYSADLVEKLFTYPIITPVKLSKALKIHYTTASRYLNELSKSGILREKKFGKYHLFANYKLLEILIPSRKK